MGARWKACEQRRIGASTCCDVEDMGEEEHEQLVGVVKVEPPPMLRMKVTTRLWWSGAGAVSPSPSRELVGWPS